MSQATRTSTIGVSVDRRDVPPKIEGSFAFSNDLSHPGMLFGVTLRSTHAHARIAAIDIAPAMGVAGTVTVLTIADVAGDRRIGHIVADQPVLADGLVRYHGEPVAFAVSTSQSGARRAAAAIRVDYQPLPVVDDPERALDPDAPKLHSGGNLVRRVHLQRGLIERPAAVEVEGYWETGRQDQVFLAPESALALPDPDGGVTLHVATQDLHADRRQVAAALALPEDQVRLVMAGVGGAFGGREDISLQVHLCLAALVTGRPVKATYLRSESFVAHPKRHPSRMWYIAGADRDGRLRYVKARLLLDGGAYASTSGPVTGNAAYFAAGPYRVDAVDITAESVYTNNPVSGAMRGFGAVQACFGIESTLDLLARRLGIEPLELRRRNALRPGDRFPTSGQVLTAATPVREVIERCAAQPLPPRRRGDHPYDLPGGMGRTTRGEGVKRGVGFAVGVKGMLYAEGTPEHSEATIRISAAGAEVVSAAAEVGQGIISALAQIATDRLGGLPVTVAPATTGAGYAGSSSASRQTWMSGGAVIRACELATQRMAEIVARRHGVPATAVRLVDGRVETGDGQLQLKEAIGDEIIEATAVYRAPSTRMGDPNTGEGDVHVGFMYVAHRAVVDVDVELGLVKVVQLATAQDVGMALNPREVRGQAEGATVQGLGLALLESLQTSGGIVRNATLTDYLLPTAADTPPILSDLVEEPEPLGPYGLKGVGEPGTLSSTPAIAAAIRAATGCRIDRVPVRPDDIVLG